jgi:hypothetical protein
MARVAVMGCGPAGLIAAYAVEQLGHTVTIFSRPTVSRVFGAMYLHAPIPNISDREPELQIDVQKIGTREGYAENVYGDPNAPVSWDKFDQGWTPGWDLGKAYRRLWQIYEQRIVSAEIFPHRVHDMTKDYSLVFSTVPQQILCRDWSHTFTSRHIWVVHGKARREEKRYGNMMVYNGTEQGESKALWYRYSIIGGYQSWEFATKQAPNYLEARGSMDGLEISDGIKPLTTNCDCFPEVVRLGRFGKWDKNAFTHEAFKEAQDAMLAL